MVFAKEYQKKSGLSEGNTTNEIGMNVVIDDGVFQGTCDISQVKQEQRYYFVYLKCLHTFMDYAICAHKNGRYQTAESIDVVF